MKHLLFILIISVLYAVVAIPYIVYGLWAFKWSTFKDITYDYKQLVKERWLIGVMKSRKHAKTY